MNITATLTTESKDAKSVADALNVDNAGMNVETRAEKNRIITKVDAESIRTLVNTLDDVIRCQIAAEKGIESN